MKNRTHWEVWNEGQPDLDIYRVCVLEFTSLETAQAHALRYGGEPVRVETAYTKEPALCELCTARPSAETCFVAPLIQSGRLGPDWKKRRTVRLCETCKRA